MTREEARNLLNNSKPKDNNAYSIMLNDALDMAIKALEQEPCEDAISRQAVLDIINFEDKWLLDTKRHNANAELALRGMKVRVSSLPPITPQYTDNDSDKSADTFEKLLNSGFYERFRKEDNNANVEQARQVAIKALEQNSILDKIRAEIEEFAKNPDFGELSLGASCGAMKVIEIIDKYRAESEAEDSDNLDSMLEDLWNATESEE